MIKKQIIFEFFINYFEKTTRMMLVKLRLMQKKFSLVDCFCEKCGRKVSMDYNISSEILEQLPEEYRNQVLCFSCLIDEIGMNDEIFRQIIWW